jgi:hypothetical protein
MEESLLATAYPGDYLLFGNQNGMSHEEQALQIILRTDVRPSVGSTRMMRETSAGYTSTIIRLFVDVL